MGDPSNRINPTSYLFSSLPPGCRFYPSDEQLICYYLTSKINGDGFDVIKEIDLYNFDPFHLPDAACFHFGRGGRRRHWYCFVPRSWKDGCKKRTAACGYWKRRGRSKDVLSCGAEKTVVGTRKSFDFYVGNSPKSAARTDWVMYEYALIDDDHDHGGHYHQHHMASYVLCRVFIKSHHGKSALEHVISSCGEESVATVRHIGVQYDGIMSSAIAEAPMHDEESVDNVDDVSNLPARSTRVLDDFTTSNLVVGQIRSTRHIRGDAMIAETLSSQELRTIIEGDFLELDDLFCPLVGID